VSVQSRASAYTGKQEKHLSQIFRSPSPYAPYVAHVLKVVVSVVNFIPSHGINHLQFLLTFLLINAEYGDILHHKYVRWLSRETVSKRLLVLRLEVELLLKKKVKVMTVLSNEKWLCDLTLIYINHRFNDLNTKFQGQNKLIFNKFRGYQSF
jgi:hypothetical protein